MLILLDETVKGLLSEKAQSRLEKHIRTIVRYEYSDSEVKQVEVDIVGSKWDIFILLKEDYRIDWEYDLEIILKEII